MRIHTRAKALGFSHVCVNDDDTIVCAEYQRVVEECVKRFPDAILTFFDNRVRRCPTAFLRRKNCELAGAGFVLPLKYLDAYKRFYAVHLAKYGFTWEETTTKMFALMNDIDVILVVPNPVDVRGNLVTVARKGNYTTPQSPSFIRNFPMELLKGGGGMVTDGNERRLFNLHLPQGCDTANMIMEKWRLKNENRI